MKIITKRDVLFFLIGIFTMLLIDSILDWDNSVKAFSAGVNAANVKAETEQVK